MLQEYDLPRSTRRQLLKGAGAVVAAGAAGGGAFGATLLLGGRRPEPRIRSFAARSTGAKRRFSTLPDLLPPAVQTTGARGEPVLTWWEGNVVNPGFGQGEGVIVDASYREVARVRAGNRRQADLHEFQLTPHGTALITCCPESVATDLSAIGVPGKGNVLGSIIQEIDVQSGRVLFEWHSLDHIPVSDTYEPFTEPYDYFHANSIDLLPDGDLLISARATFALYKLNRRTGEVVWDGSGPEKTESQSRGIVLDVDSASRRVRLARAYRHPEPLLAGSMGSVQVLPKGRMLVGWGAQRYTSEFTADGKLLGDAMLPAPLLSYRSYRSTWTATPKGHPAVAAHRNAVADPPILFASWNGATDVAHSRVHTGPTAHHLKPLGIARRRGFETVDEFVPGHA